MEINSPKISVILPCYNVEKYIAKSIQSVLNQTFDDFELLVIIDGSPDNSISVAETFKDERITIFEKPNGGLSDARNYGLERAKGEFVYFMDSDDWIEKDLIEKTITILENEKLDLVIFGYIQDNEDHLGKVISSNTILPNSKSRKKVNNNNILDQHLLGLLGYAWNKVYRKALLINNKITFEKGTSLIEDILFNAKVYNSVDILHFINEGYYHYLNRPTATLIKQFHADSFQLKLRKNQILSDFFQNWNFSNKNELVAFSQVQGIRYCVHNMFFYKNNLSLKNKREYIKDMVSHHFTQEVIGNYKPQNYKGKIYKFLIKSKQSILITLLALLIK